MRLLFPLLVSWLTTPLKATDVDDNYSKWSICDYHPELLLCRWHNKPIPPVDESVAQSSSEDSDENPFAVEPDLTAFDMSKAIVPGLPSSKSTKPSKDKDDQNMLQATTRYLHQPVSAPVTKPRQPQPPRYDGKLSSEHETAVSYAAKRKEMSDEEKFDENIMVASEDVFG
ncbi:unnamed protein product [Heligmosomoides polygyrus]|uniref:Secreted protein n=1 Tax=Heligmosomoides polygyrus TaxID=6339 RepID=A0A3P7XZ81_HELPZ|nr:unnamed protein product [Heligmosomoides polygyrus]